MLIILEGIDGTGKSTLAHNIKKTIRVQYPDDFVFVHHKGKPKAADAIAEYLEPIKAYKPGGKEHIICDRWHLGELVYPTVLGRLSIMTGDQFDTIEDFLVRSGAIIVHVMRNNHADHAEQLMDRDDMVVNPEMLPDLRRAFADAMARTQLPVYQHDYDMCGGTCEHIDEIITTAVIMENAAQRGETIWPTLSTAKLDVLSTQRLSALSPNTALPATRVVLKPVISDM